MLLKLVLSMKKEEETQEALMLGGGEESHEEDCQVWGLEREECETTLPDCEVREGEDGRVQEQRAALGEELQQCETNRSRACASPPEHWLALEYNFWQAAEWQFCSICGPKESEHTE